MPDLFERMVVILLSCSGNEGQDSQRVFSRWIGDSDVHVEVHTPIVAKIIPLSEMLGLFSLSQPTVPSTRNVYNICRYCKSFFPFVFKVLKLNMTLINGF
jgi:hypothetical protein